MTKNQHQTDQTTFIPAFLSFRKNQYLITACFMIFFALIGFVAGFFVPFQYEAEATLVTNLELVEDTNITELMVYSQLEIVRQLMFHPDITDQVLENEKLAGNPISLDQLTKMSIIERRLSTTLIKVRGKDPQVAARIATSWAQAAYDRLTEAYEHALLVSEAKWVITSTEKCLEDEKVFTTTFCENLTLEGIESQTKDAQAVIIAESPFALGLTKDIQISQYKPAAIPSTPVQGGRGNMVLIGAMIGLVISLIVFELPIFDSKQEAG